MADLPLYCETLRCLGMRGMSELLVDRFFSFNNVFILQKSLSTAVAPNPHRMQLSISKIDERDWDDILKQAQSLDVESRREILARAFFFRNDFRNCFAVRRGMGPIAHIQWIVFPEENDVIGSRYRGLFKPLERYETMIENAFTFPRFRGLGLYTYATRHLLNLAGELEYRKATAYVRAEKFGSLNELIAMGFSIKRVVREYKVLGVTRRGLYARTGDGRQPHG